MGVIGPISRITNHGSPPAPLSKADCYESWSHSMERSLWRLDAAKQLCSNQLGVRGLGHFRILIFNHLAASSEFSDNLKWN